MSYLCDSEIARAKRAISLFFPPFEDKLRLKTLNLQFSAKKQVNFRAFYLLSHKLLVVNQSNMLHRYFASIIIDLISPSIVTFWTKQSIWRILCE